MKRAFKILLRARSSVKSPERTGSGHHFFLDFGMKVAVFLKDELKKSLELSRHSVDFIFVSAGCRPRGAENRVSETFAGYGARARTGDSSGAEPLGT